MAAAAQAKAVEVPTVTRIELSEIAKWEKQLSEAKKVVSEAEKQLDWRRLALAVKVLGVGTEAEYRALDPDELAKLMWKRMDAGKWKLGYGARMFSFEKTAEGRYPPWGRLFIEHMGEAEAKAISAGTPKLYSYRVEVTS